MLERFVKEPEKLDRIFEVKGIIEEYLDVKAIQNLGLQIHHSEIDFDKVMLFSWIKEEIENVREDRVSGSSHKRPTN